MNEARVVKVHNSKSERFIKLKCVCQLIYEEDKSRTEGIRSLQDMMTPKKNQERFKNIATFKICTINL